MGDRLKNSNLPRLSRKCLAIDTTFARNVFAAALAMAALFTLNAQADCPVIDPGPTPLPIPALQTTNATTRVLVSGTLGLTDVGPVFVTPGQTKFNLLNPSPLPSPALCPIPTFQPVFTPFVNAPAKNSLVMVYGTADSFSNATFSFTDRNGKVLSPVTVSPTPPTTGFPGFSPPPIPANMSGGYFLLSVTTDNNGASNSPAFSYTTTKPGEIGYTIRTEVIGSAATLAIDSMRKTTFRPRLSFFTPAKSILAGTCSTSLTVNSVDGNGLEVPVQPGASSIAKILISGSPADIFLDSNCVYPTTSLRIVNPTPSPSPALRPSDVSSNSRVTFYFKSFMAGSFPITATYVDTDSTQLVQTAQAQNSNAKQSVSIELTGPSAATQGSCSSPFKLRLLDQYGNEAVAAPVPKVIKLKGSVPGVEFFSDASCTVAINPAADPAISIPVNSSQVVFYVRAKDAAAIKILANDALTGLSAHQGSSASFSVLSSGNVAAASDPIQAKALAIRLYDRLAGVPISLRDPNLEKMSALIQEGKTVEAAHIATDQPGFYDITLKSMVTPLSSRLYNPLENLNDFTATWIGIVRDNRDARELLTGNRIYVGAAQKTANDQTCPSSSVLKDNSHFKALENSYAKLKDELVPVPQCAYNTGNFASDTPVVLEDTAGLLTTRTWGVNHLEAGTNRRAIAFALEVFLCKGMTDVADSLMPDWHIRRDVDRAPGGSPIVYNASCRSCHGGMDALAGAYAFFDAYNDVDNRADFRLFYIKNGGGYSPTGIPTVMPKMNQNGNVFPPGWVTGDDSWNNFFTERQNEALGWSSAASLKGNGVHPLGEMLANSQAFSSCMAKRVFKEVCRREPLDTEAALLSDLSLDFQATQYNMRRLFEKAATLSVCLGKGE